MPLRYLYGLVAAALACGAAAASLTVEVGNVAEARGDLHVTVYDGPETWLSLQTRRATEAIAVPADSGDAIAATFDLPAGRYAIAVHHDVNGNGKVDYSLLRLPKEPFGFSNDVKPKLSRPAFEAAAFDLGDEGLTVSVKLL